MDNISDHRSEDFTWWTVVGPCVIIKLSIATRSFSDVYKNMPSGLRDVLICGHNSISSRVTVTKCQFNSINAVE